MMVKSNKKLIPMQKVRGMTFTKEEQKDLDIKGKLKIAMRKLREEREALGMTQDELSLKSGVPRTTITKIESGYHNPSIMKLSQLAGAMGMYVEVDFVKVRGAA